MFYSVCNKFKATAWFSDVWKNKHLNFKLDNSIKHFGILISVFTIKCPIERDDIGLLNIGDTFSYLVTSRIIWPEEFLIILSIETIAQQFNKKKYLSRSLVELTLNFFSKTCSYNVAAISWWIT